MSSANSESLLFFQSGFLSFLFLLWFLWPKLRNDSKAETPMVWPPHAKGWLIGKDPDAGRDWGQEEKGTTEDEMAGWHHPLDGHEFEWTLGVGDGQGGLVCCSPWGCKESDTTERLNWIEVNHAFAKFSSPLTTVTDWERYKQCPTAGGGPVTLSQALGCWLGIHSYATVCRA